MKNILKILLTAALVLSLVFTFACAAVADGPDEGDEPADTTAPEDTADADTTVADTEPADTEVKKTDPPEYNFSRIILTKSFEKFTYKASNGVELPYCLYVPENYSDEYAYPLFLFLHGAGERSNENGAQVKLGVQDFFVPKNTPIYNSIAVYPLCAPGEGWTDNNWDLGSYSIEEYPISDQMVAVVELLDYLIDTYSINTDRQYVTGLSMGGYGTWDIIARYPERFAAAAPLCGGGDPSVAERLVDIPIWVFHDVDDDAVPVSGSQDMVNAIKAAGGEKILYTESQGIGHGIWNKVYGDLELQKWMFSQVKK